MFDPDGDQAAADSTRSSTSLDTGSSLNTRTARRLVTASYTSMIAYLPPAIRSTSDAGSGCRPRAAEPFVETDAAEARFAQRHQRVFLDPAAEVPGLGVAHDLTWVTDRPQIAGDE